MNQPVYLNAIRVLCAFVWTHLLNSEFFVKSHHQRNVDFRKFPNEVSYQDEYKNYVSRTVKICGLMENIFLKIWVGPTKVFT